MKKIIKLIYFVLAVVLLISCQSRNKFTPNNLGKVKTLKKTIKVAQTKVHDDSIYKIPDILATFHGGSYARMEFFKKNLKYPKRFTNNHTENVVILTFIVETDSTVSNVKIIRGIDNSFNKEATRLVKKAKWNPGKVNGKPVRSVLTFPVIFNKTKH